MSKRKSRRTCEICGAKEAHLESPRFFANFPLEENRCKEWVRVTGNEDLVHLPIEKLHFIKHICGEHFKTTHINKKKTRLKKRAVPCLKLTCAPLTDDQMSGFPFHLWKNQVLESNNETSTRKDVQGAVNEKAMSPQPELKALETIDDVVMHVFPNPEMFPERYKAWIDRVGDMEALTAKEIRQRKRICDIHFAEEHRNRNKRLNALAVPTLYLPKKYCEKEKLHVDHDYAKDVKLLPSAVNIADSTNIDSPGPASCTTTNYDFPTLSTTTLRHDLEIEQCEDMDNTDMDDFLDAPLSPEDNIPPTHGSSHTEHHRTSLVEDHQTVRNNQTTGTDPQDSSLLDDDPIRDLGIDDSVSELLNIASEHPAVKKIEVDEESIERVERDQCTALYMELLERICDAFDRIPRFVKEKLPGYDEKVYAQMAQLKIKLKIVIKPLVKECVRVEDPLALEEHCTDVTKLYGDDSCDAELQEAEKSNFAQSATHNQATEFLDDDQQIVEIEYLEENLETDEIENLQESHSVLKHKDIHKKEYLEDKLSKNPENTAYKVRTHPSPRVHSGKPYRNLKPYVLLEDYRRSSNMLHNTAINRNLKGKPTRFILEDNHTESSFLSSTTESPHKYKVKMKHDLPQKELNS